MPTNIPEFIIVHHTGGTSADPLADTSHHTFEGVNAYHKSLGWKMIGYHWYIEKNGAIKKGRNETDEGAHTLGMNTKSIGVCLAGNFDTTLPTAEQIQSLIVCLKGIRSRYKIPVANILPHRKFSVKTCYGSKLPDTWAQDLLLDTKAKAQLLEKIEELRVLVNALE